LIREKKLIDEFYLFVNPIVMGSGKTIFRDLKEIQKLTLIDSKVFDCGLVLLHYEVKKN
jgi:dihydrofolate reductase